MLHIEHASKRFGDVPALQDCTVSVPRGRMLGFLGPNGAGKTTAMRAIFSLVALDAGKLTWDDGDITLEQRRRFGYMPEERGLYPRMAVGEQVVYFARLHGLTETDAEREARGWLERLDLADRADAKLDELSHGNQQRAQLAAALAHRPDLLVLDEPFAGLDPVAVVTLAEILRDEARRGAAVLFSSHQLDLVEDICEDVAIIDHGRVVATGALETLRRLSTRRRIDIDFDGAPEDWIPDVPGVTLLDRRNGNLRLNARRDVDPQRVLAEAEQAGAIAGFAYRPPSLAELFLELVER